MADKEPKFPFEYGPIPEEKEKKEATEKGNEKPKKGFFGFLKRLFRKKST